MSTAKPLTYAGRCERYARQRGWHYDERRLSISHLTPCQRRRALKKERHAWPCYSRRAIDMPWDCDVCGLPDPYQGTGDGIGSCDCPRCQCGAARGSQFCTCTAYGIEDYDDEEPYCATPGCDCCGDDDD